MNSEGVEKARAAAMECDQRYSLQGGKMGGSEKRSICFA
jgi:hypothetical protein